MTYRTDPGSGGTPSYGSQPEPSASYGKLSRPRGRPVGWTLGTLAALAALLFGVSSCSGGGDPGTTPPTPVVYPPTASTTPTAPAASATPNSGVVYPPTVGTDEPPTSVRPPVSTTTPPVTATTPALPPPTQINAGSGGDAADDRDGTLGLVITGLLFVAVASATLLRGRRRSS